VVFLRRAAIFLVTCLRCIQANMLGAEGGIHMSPIAWTIWQVIERRWLKWEAPT